MKNAGQELFNLISDVNSDLITAAITLVNPNNSDDRIGFNYCCNLPGENLSKLLDSLNFNYEQGLYGTVQFSNGLEYRRNQQTNKWELVK